MTTSIFIILDKQIARLAKVYNSKEVTVESIDWHIRVMELQKPLLEKMCKLIAIAKQTNKNAEAYGGIVPFISDKFEAGAIVCDFWGWEQTNIDFYCIVKRSGYYVTVLPMFKTSTPDGELLSMVTLETPSSINLSAAPIRKRVRVYSGVESGFSLREGSGGGHCSTWNGKPKRASHYA